MIIPASIEPTNSFDKGVKLDLAIARPDNYAQLFKILNNTTQKIIPRGAGLSYAPASFIENGVAISTERFNRVLHLDKATGQVICESGIRICDLQELCLKAGWYLPVLPGYPSITIGGCVAFNIHGKSQYHSGNFVDCLAGLKIYHPDHGELNCSRTENAELFLLTAGGMGLTGFITEVTINLAKATFKSISLSKHKVKNIYEGIDFLINEAENYKAVYSWHNFMNKGTSFGKGLVYCEQYADKEVPRKRMTKFVTANDKKLPFSLLSYPTTYIMNQIYEFKESLGRRVKEVDLNAGSFPIYGKEIYYALFGKKGFIEYQLIAPFDQINPMLKEIEQWIQTHKQPVSLASLKLFKGKQELLNFCMEGVCLAIDVPNTEKGKKFFAFLDQLCLDSGSIMNIAKDSRLSEQTVKGAYSEYETFKNQVNSFDKRQLFSSVLSNRIGI